jgi:hypothetical protein
MKKKIESFECGKYMLPNGKTYDFDEDAIERLMMYRHKGVAVTVGFESETTVGHVIGYNIEHGCLTIHVGLDVVFLDVVRRFKCAAPCFKFKDGHAVEILEFGLTNSPLVPLSIPRVCEEEKCE